MAANKRIVPDRTGFFFFRWFIAALRSATRLFSRREEDRRTVDQILDSVRFKTPQERRNPKEIPWEAVVELINAGKIISAMQAHSRKIWITTVDGVSYASREPKIDLIMQLIRAAPNGKEIVVATE